MAPSSRACPGLCLDPDGGRPPLNARIWLPATDERVGVVLTYEPTRTDGSRAWLIASCIHADRGRLRVRPLASPAAATQTVSWTTNTSRPSTTTIEVLEWLAGQPWCSGKVGMRGLSWSGFNALQVAAGGRPRSGRW